MIIKFRMIGRALARSLSVSLLSTPFVLAWIALKLKSVLWTNLCTFSYVSSCEVSILNRERKIKLRLFLINNHERVFFFIALTFITRFNIVFGSSNNFLSTPQSTFHIMLCFNGCWPFAAWIIRKSNEVSAWIDKRQWYLSSLLRKASWFINRSLSVYLTHWAHTNRNRFAEHISSSCLPDNPD